MKLATAHMVKIGDEYFSPNHPVATAWLLKHGLQHGAGGLVEIKDKPAKRLRQSSRPLLNKLEQAFHDDCLKYRHQIVLTQSIRFKLGNGIWYKPDFIAIPVGLESQDTRWRAFEVKGPHAFRGGFENLKVAAGIYKQVRFVLVWKDKKTGQWLEQHVLP